MTDQPRRGKRRNPILVMIALGIIALLTWWLGPDAPDAGDAGGGSSQPTSSPSITFQDPADAPTSDGGSTVAQDSAPPAETESADDTAAGEPPESGEGIQPCTDPLPAEADAVIGDIAAGGPFDYPRNDGVTFENREDLLPDEPAGYYREYTVETPGSQDRGARRIVTGGEPPTDPEHWYFTDDHYDSFCAFAP